MKRNNTVYRMEKSRSIRTKVGSAISRLIGLGILAFLTFSWYWYLTGYATFIKSSWGLNLFTIGGFITGLGILGGLAVIVVWAIITFFIGMLGFVLLFNVD